MGKNRLSFNQASGKIREMKDELESGAFKADILKRIEDESKISIAPSQDRHAFLMNALKAYDEATPHGYRVFLGITREVSSTFSRKQVGKILKSILEARINGYNNYQISEFFKLKENLIIALEELAKLELQESLEKKGFLNDTPSDGGLIIP